MQIVRHQCVLFGLFILLPGIGPPGIAQVSEIQRIVAVGQLEEMRRPDFRNDRPHVQRLYKAMGFTPLWLNGPQPKPAALSMIAIFQNAAEEGLDPEDYDASRWRSRLESLAQSTNAQARFDVTMSVCAMRYASALHNGRINPRSIHRTAVFEKRFDPVAFLRERLLVSPDLAAAFASIEPPFAAYRRTKQALVRYIELARLDDGQELPLPRKTIDPGQVYAGVPRLTLLLRLLGDLPNSSTITPDAQVYDTALAEGVKRFQRRHGLEEDGRLGRATIKQLNVPLQNRVQQLQLALERWRWLTDGISRPTIFVNIPDFRLRAVDQTGIALEMRVVVGRAMRTQTPVFSAEMTHVIFRPYWNVPRSIVRNEIVPAVERDPQYLVSKKFEVTTRSGEIVTAGPVSDEVLALVRQGTLTVRQRPGPINSLGLVKLMFPNENNVYLHDTPARSLFARSRRDFSHGCIRVEKPAELAAWVLRGTPGWTLEKVRQAMQSGEDDVTVSLSRPVPVFIVYGTALAYENGEVHFSNDIYGFDAKLAAALSRGYPYP